MFLNAKKIPPKTEHAILFHLFWIFMLCRSRILSHFEVSGGPLTPPLEPNIPSHLIFSHFAVFGAPLSPVTTTTLHKSRRSHALSNFGVFEELLHQKWAPPETTTFRAA